MYVLDFTLTGFILIALYYVLLYLFTISSNSSIYTFLDTEVMILKLQIKLVNFVLQSSTKSFSNNRFSFATC